MKKYAIVNVWASDNEVTGDAFSTLGLIEWACNYAEKYCRSYAVHGLTFEDFAV
jgi:hypothetical protein